MTEQTQNPIIEHDKLSRRFLLRKDGHTAILDYSLEDNLITFTHTGVPIELEGRGIGSQLAHAGLEYARENNFKVLSLCWFVSGYIERHAEYQGLIKK